MDVRVELEQASRSMQFALSDAKLIRLVQYLALFQKWNAAYNLSALKSQQDILIKHLFDCLAIVSSIEAEINSRPALAKTILDIGTGAGLPGLILAICLPNVQVTMLDAIHKKITFVQHVIGQLKLENATAHAIRIQDWKDAHTVITARAWTALADIPRLSAHTVALGGCIAAMKGPRLATEAEALPNDWQITNVIPIAVPQLLEERSLAILQRV